MFKGLSTFVNLVVSSYFTNFHCIYNIGSRNSHLWIRDNAVISCEDDAINANFLQHNCEGILVQSEDPKSMLDRFESSIEFKQSTRHYTNIRKYVFLVHDQSGVDAVFQSPLLNNLTDILIANLEPNSSCVKSSIFLCDWNNFSIDLFTHSYSGREYNARIYLDTWFSVNESFLYGTNLFPNKLFDQFGREISVACLEYIPYSNPGEGLYSGTEMNLMRTYAKKHNATLVTNILSSWGNVNESGYATGMLGSVIRQQSDVAFSGIFISSMTYKYLEYSHIYIESEITCITPSPKIRMPFNMLFPKYKTKFAMVFVPSTIICIFVTYKLLARFTKATIFDAFLLVWKIYLQQSFALKISGIGFYIMYLIFFSLIISSSYTTNLTSIFAVPKFEGDINTVVELAASDMKIIAKEVHLWTRAFINDPRPKFKKLMKNAREFDDNYGTDNTVAYIVERFPSGYYAFDDSIAHGIISQYKAMSGYLYKSKSVFVFKKNSILVPDFNFHLLQIQQAGINLKWEADSVVHSKSFYKQFDISHEFYKMFNRRKLNLRAFRGVFIVWICGALTSTFVFTIELIYFNILKK